MVSSLRNRVFFTPILFMQPIYSIRETCQFINNFLENVPRANVAGYGDVLDPRRRRHGSLMFQDFLVPKERETMMLK
jgi:hypothetical protein